MKQIRGFNIFSPEKLNKYRLLWNLKQFLFTGGYSGFQYSDFFLNKLSKCHYLKKMIQFM